MKQVALNSVEDALAYLSTYGDAEDGPDVVFGGELTNLHATIEGRDYHGTVPGELARGLAELQDEFYRAAAFALHGDDRINRLTADERESFELVFAVKEGSSEIDADLGNFWSKLGDGFVKMKSEHKRTVMIVIALVVAMGWGGPKVYETFADVEKAKVEVEKAKVDVEKAKVEATSEKDREAEKTRQMTLFADLAAKIPAAERFDRAVTDGARAVIKGAKDADSITLNRTHFDRAAVEDINQRAAKDKAEAKIFTNEFRIVGLESRNESLKVWLETRGVKQFSVIIGDDEEADADLLHAIWNAARERKLITLEISATYIRGQMKTAQVVRRVPTQNAELLYQTDREPQKVVGLISR